MDAERYSVLHLPEAFDPGLATEADPLLFKLMGWTANIVRLPWKSKTYEALDRCSLLCCRFTARKEEPPGAADPKSDLKGTYISRTMPFSPLRWPGEVQGRP